MRLRPLVIACLIAAAAGPAVGQRASDPRAGEPDSELTRLQSEYRDEQVRARRLRAEAAAAGDEVADLEQRLRALRRAADADDIQIDAQRARLKELGAREARLVAELSRERAGQGRLLSALQMMSRRPPPPLLIPSDRARDTVRAAILMKAMAPEIEARAQGLVDRQNEVVRIRRLAALSSERLFTTESVQGDRRAEIEALTVRQTALESVLRAEARRSERAARALEARIRELGGVARFDASNAPTPISRLPGGRDRLTPPVDGAPSETFGRGSSGWRWRADRTTVKAPTGARVAYAGHLGGWGQVIILDLGGGWRAVVAGLDEVQVETDARVSDGQALGRTGADGEAYFELRRDDRPIDPSPWLR